MNGSWATTTLGALCVVGTSIGLVGLAETPILASAARSSPASAPKAFVSTLGQPAQIGSTVPPNGDVNPYGVALVTASVGHLEAGDVLVSNFNDKANVQGTGTTLVELSPTGKLTVFAQLSSLPPGQRCPGGIGLGTGLVILPGGFVVVGSVPAAGPSGAPAAANPNGCLIVLSATGKVVGTWSNPAINGPWDMTSSVSGNRATIFVSNVLSRPSSLATVPTTGSCTISRLSVTLGSGVPQLVAATTIATGFPWEVNKSTFMLGPTGLALSPTGVLYVAQTLGNDVNAIPGALTRRAPLAYRASILTHGGSLDAPLGMVMAPNGDVVVTNGNDGNLVEIDPEGHQVAKATLIKNGAGDLFGIALAANGTGIVFVDDGANAIDRASRG